MNYFLRIWYKRYEMAYILSTSMLAKTPLHFLSDSAVFTEFHSGAWISILVYTPACYVLPLMHRSGMS